MPPPRPPNVREGSASAVVADCIAQICVPSFLEVHKRYSRLVDWHYVFNPAALGMAAAVSQASSVPMASVLDTSLGLRDGSFTRRKMHLT